MGKRSFVVAICAMLLVAAFASMAAGNMNGPVEGSVLESGLPTPTAGPPPDGNNPPPLATVEPPGSDPPPWLISGPVRTSAVLHWTELQSASGTPETTGDIWIELDNNGGIKRLHTYVTQSDGTFVQENGYEGQRSYTVWNAGAHPLHSESACVDAGSSPPPPAPLGPPFIADATALERFGFIAIPSVTSTVPTTSPLDGIEPLQTFSSGEPWSSWEMRTTLPNGREQLLQMSVGTDQHGIYGAVIELASDGSVIRKAESSYGDLYVYNPDTVPDSVFAKISTVEEPCYEPH